MTAEFDILGGFVSQDAIKEFEDLGKAIDKSATSAATLLKSLEGIKAKQDYSKQAAKLAEINAKLESQMTTLNAKLEAKEKEHQMRLEAAKTTHLATLERQEKAYQDKVALLMSAQEKKLEVTAIAHADKTAQIAQASSEKKSQIAQAAADKLVQINTVLTERASVLAQTKADKEINAAIRAAEKEATISEKRVQKELASVEALSRARRIADAKAAFTPTAEEKISSNVGVQAQAQVMKLNAVIASEYTSSLQKLDAQIKLNVIDAQKFVAVSDTQNPKYLELIGNTKKLSTEYDRMAKAAGANMTKTNSMYGATFSLTQVMRELPNFAIDARVGFMALSNNLPMLAENFQNVAKEIDTTTGKKKGFVGAMKEFGSSLLSLNTIMIVLTTAMVLWGEDLVKLFKGDIPIAEKALASFVKELKSGSGEFTTATKKFMEVSAIMTSASRGFISQKDAIEEYNKAFGKTNGYVTTFAEAQKRLIDQAPFYVKAMAMMGLANSFLEEATKSAGEAEALRVDKTVSFWDRLLNRIRNVGTNAKEVTKTVDEKTEVLNRRNAKANEAEKASKDALKQYQEEYARFAKYAEEHGIDIWGDDKKEGGGSRGRAKKAFSEILVAQEFYDHERAMLIEKMAELEDDISKTTIKGELNGYEQRTDAAELYYETLKRLAMSDRDVAIATTNEKLAHEKKVIKDKYDDNVRKFGAGSSEASKSANELATGNATLEQNNANDILKITDDFNKKVLDGSRKQASQMYTIQQDMYADEVYLLERAQAKKLNALGIESNAQKAKTSSKSNLQLLNSALGGSSNTSVLEIKDAEDTAKKKLEIERNLIRDELALDTTSGEKRKELWRKLAENDVAITELRAKTVQEIELEMAKTAEESRAEIISKSIDTLKTLWEGYYAYQADKIDANLDRQTKINNEAVKQYEDEADAGKHSAKELSDFKDRTAAYQSSQDEEAARKKKELDKEQFLTTQGFALAQVWIQYALTQGAIATAAAVIAATPIVGPALSLAYAAKASAANLGTAIAGTALIAARTIPAFAEGGTMGKDGKALIGDGGKNELIMTPAGDWYVSPKVPTVVDMQAGTKIFPDINKLDLNSFLAMAQVQPQMLKTDNLEKEIKGLRQDVRNQKQGNFYGMPLIRQLNNSSRYSARKRGLMN